ncbi:hypothetical protein COB64_02315 [Candidatus Wolfebacteria bacterium]|nr:MAG: hypothetical protein COB64_02315 [Candidatus Wolfebacteria bacterium]
MARFSLNNLPEDERIRLIGEFYDVMGLIKDRKEASKIFRDILDIDEIGNIMRRIDVAILLILNFTYDEIVELLNVGKNKITNVQKKLDRGGEGYRILIQRILEKRKKGKIKEIKLKRKKKRQQTNPEFERLKRKYPTSFLFWNIVDELGDSFNSYSEIKDDKKESDDFYKKNETNI